METKADYIWTEALFAQTGASLTTRPVKPRQPLPTIKAQASPRLFEDRTYRDASAWEEARFDNNKVISLFSGAGGMDIGLEMAGYETAVCVEVDPHCRETLRRNRPQWHLPEGDNIALPGDIRALSSAQVLEAAGLRVGEAALVVGGPPCQPFSNIGKRLGAEDELNGDLSHHFVRMVTECLPQAFIFENVGGFGHAKHRDTLDYILHQTIRAGYGVVHTVLNAADYGVPQQRKRFLILGLRNDGTPHLPFPSRFPNPAEAVQFHARYGGGCPPDFAAWKTVADAFASLPEGHEKRADFVVMNISPVVQDRMRRLAQGENFKALPMEMRPNCWKNGKHQGQDTFGRLRADKPSVTIRTAAYNPAKGSMALCC